MALFIFLILIVYLFIIIQKKVDFLSPRVLFTLVILITYLITCFNISGLQHQYPWSFTGLIFLLILNFNIGTLLAGKRNSGEMKKFANKNILNEKLLKWSVFFLFFLIVASFAITWKVLGAPPLISKVERSSYYLSFFGSFYLLLYSLFFLLVYDFYTNRYLKNKFWFFIICLFLIVLMMSNKFQMIYLICQWLIVRNFTKKKIKIKSLVLLGLAGLFVFVLYYSFIYNKVYISADRRNEVNQIKLPEDLLFVSDAYVYVAFNYENLYHYIYEVDAPHTYGTQTFSSVINNMPISLPENHQSLWKDNLQYKWLTTGTIFKEFYMDFGILGMLICVFILGFLTQKVYFNLLYKSTIFNIYLYCAMAFSLMVSFFTNNFITTSFLFNLVVMLVISFFNERWRVK